MKNKFTLLILISVLALLALCAIQAYLISNTYELKKVAFFRDADRAVSEIGNTKTLDSLYDFVVDDDLADHISDFINNRIPKSQVYDNMKVTANKLNPLYIENHEKELLKLELGYEIKHQLKVTSVVMFIEDRLDSIFSISDVKDAPFFGRQLEGSPIITVNTSRMYSTNEYVKSVNDSIYTSTYDLEVRTQERIVVPNWRSIVFGQMWVLILGSCLLFIFVIGLLYYSIKNLITQKKIAEIKTDFINNVTHELKTPLATLGIATKSLRSEVIKSNLEAFENTLGIVDRQNSRLQKLIDQVLTKSLSAEELHLNKEQVIDNTFFTDLLFDFKTSTQDQDLEIINVVYQPEVCMRIDRFHLTTALLNILENAVKYGKDAIKIKVDTFVQNRYYVIAITDNGTGISEKDQKAIFDKFYRAENGNVHDVKGLGLGLYFTHQIITAHDGTITCQSEFGKGTTFTIKLPI